MCATLQFQGRAGPAVEPFVDQLRGRAEMRDEVRHLRVQRRKDEAAIARDPRLAEAERTALASASPEALCAHLPLLENQVSNVWSMGKDGRSYWPVKRQAATADRIANHKGRNPQERASLKKRLLRKWMSK